MNMDRMKAKIDEVVGGAKRKAGEWTDDTNLEVEGMAQQIEGKVENALGKVKDGFRHALENPEASLDAQVTLEVKSSKAKHDRASKDVK